MSKLTAAQLIAMAAAQGIHLHEAGAESFDRTTELAQIRGERDSLRLALADANRDNSAKVQADQAHAFRQQRDALAAELAEARGALADLRTTVVKLQGERFTLQGELAEARNDQRANQRSAERQRQPSGSRDPDQDGRGIDAHPELARVRPEINHAERINDIINPTRGFGLRFHAAQGRGTADRIRAVGGRWRFTSKANEPVAGYWIMPDSDDARALSRELSLEGKQVEPFAL